MFCSACGSEISLAEAACPNCGRVVAPNMAAGLSLERAPALTRKGVVAHEESATSSSGAWFASADTLAAPSASIFAGDLDLPGFPRDLPRRIALLTGLVMTADLLLPWVTVNGDGVAPVRLGAPSLLLVLALVIVIAPPLVPRIRNTSVARLLPFAIGALLLGVGLTLWLAITVLAPALIASFTGRVENAGGSALGAALSGQAPISFQVSPAPGLYLFVLGACVLIFFGYFALPSSR